MKTKLLLFNFALVCYLTGLGFSLGRNLQIGAVLILFGASIIAILYSGLILRSLKEKRLLVWNNLMLAAGLFVLAILFLHGFSLAIDLMFYGKFLWFTQLYFAAGFVLIFLFQFFLVKNLPEEKPGWFFTIGIIASIMGFAGQAGFAGLLPFSPKLVFYSWVFFILTLSLILLFLNLRGRSTELKEYRIFLFLSLVMGGFWVFRFVSPTLPNGLFKAVIDFGFVPIIILPIAIWFGKKFYPFIIFGFSFICLDIFFLQFDQNFNYLINVGINGCENYDQDKTYPEPSGDISIIELLNEPSQFEIDQIKKEWQNRRFLVIDPEVVYEEIKDNGDTIKVIAHTVDEHIHYGAIRIPKGIDVSSAPILLELEGGGASIDVSKIQSITRNKCETSRKAFISVLPSYRGNILQGDDFCFRSEGNFRDVWHGAAIDAITLLEVVKAHYGKTDATPVLINGLSRGATVALIIGGLTDKADFIIVNSTHTKFVDRYVYDNEQVGGSLSRAFILPGLSKADIRKNLIASSPYFFADQLPPFQLHQGGDDHLTTRWHANKMQQKLDSLGKSKESYEVFIHEGKGHGYDDDQIVCEGINWFLEGSR
ncbi:MAG: hypothetical protein R8G66_00595 [Cytophagales bacterium]|nr:hypothetical protein [Cytophagales bacterium]